VVGPYEENGCAGNCEGSPSLFDPQELQSSGSAQKIRRPTLKRKQNSLLYVIPAAFYRVVRRIQGLDRHVVCPHPLSCTYYTLQVHSNVMKVHMREWMYSVMSIMQTCCFVHKYFSGSCIVAERETESQQYIPDVKEGLLPQLQLN
jgi:hypothetical protein